MAQVIAITGCLGFLGHHFVDAVLQAGYRCYLIDLETYAADLSHLDRWDDRLVHYTKADIATLPHLPDIEAIVNLAAETHVDNSVVDARKFVYANIVGVHNLLELVRAKRNYQMPRFVQISTDEVYGDWPTGQADETAPLHPSSPYAASKAAGDLLVQSYARTYGLSYNIIRPSNCYGTGQYPEKLIPKAIRYFGLGKPMTVHGTGNYRRQWLEVKDCAQAVLTVLERGDPNTTYNIGGNTEASVAEIVNAISTHFDKPSVQNDFIRSGVDTRYNVADTKLRELGWTPQGDLWRDLPSLIAAERGAWRW